MTTLALLANYNKNDHNLAIDWQGSIIKCLNNEELCEYNTEDITMNTSSEQYNSPYS